MSISLKDYGGLDPTHLHNLENLSKTEGQFVEKMSKKRVFGLFGKKEQTRIKKSEGGSVRMQKIADILKRDLKEVESLTRKDPQKAAEIKQTLGRIADNFMKQESPLADSKQKQARIKLYTDIMTSAGLKEKQIQPKTEIPLSKKGSESSSRASSDQEGDQIGSSSRKSFEIVPSKSSRSSDQESHQIESVTTSESEEPISQRTRPKFTLSQPKTNERPKSERKESIEHDDFADLDALLKGPSVKKPRREIFDESTESSKFSRAMPKDIFNESEEKITLGRSPDEVLEDYPPEFYRDDSEFEDFGKTKASSKPKVSLEEEIFKPSEKKIQQPSAKKPLIQPNRAAPTIPSMTKSHVNSGALKDLPFNNLFQNFEHAQSRFESKLPKDELLQKAAINRFKENLTSLKGGNLTKQSLTEQNIQSYYLILSHGWKKTPFEIPSGRFTTEVNDAFKILEERQSGIKENNNFANGKKLQFNNPTLNQFEHINNNLQALRDMRPGFIVKDNLDLSNLTKEEEELLTDLIRDGKVDERSIKLEGNQIIEIEGENVGLTALKKEIQTLSKEYFSEEINENLLPSSDRELRKLKNDLPQLKDILPKGKRLEYTNLNAHQVINAFQSNTPLRDHYVFTPIQDNEQVYKMTPKKHKPLK